MACAVARAAAKPTTHIRADSLATLESVQLFVERARNVSPAFALDDAAAPIVARICRRLDGIPLALELAVARLDTLSLAQIDEPSQRRVVGAHDE